jgi:hypothetical protein
MAMPMLPSTITCRLIGSPPSLDGSAAWTGRGGRGGRGGLGTDVTTVGFSPYGCSVRDDVGSEATSLSGFEKIEGRSGSYRVMAGSSQVVAPLDGVIEACTDSPAVRLRHVHRWGLSPGVD